MFAYACSYLWLENINRVTKAGAQNGSNAWINTAQATSFSGLCTCALIVFDYIISYVLWPLSGLRIHSVHLMSSCSIFLFYHHWLRHILFPYDWELIKPCSEDSMNHFHLFFFCYACHWWIWTFLPLACLQIMWWTELGCCSPVFGGNKGA